MEGIGTKVSGFHQALNEALSKSNEKERIIAVLDCIKGYKNEYDRDAEKAQFDGFMKCKNEYRNQIEKAKEHIGKHAFE